MKIRKLYCFSFCFSQIGLPPAGLCSEFCAVMTTHISQCLRALQSKEDRIPGTFEMEFLEWADADNASGKQKQPGQHIVLG